MARKIAIAPGVETFFKWVGYGVAIAVMTALVVKVSNIGWDKVFQSAPRQPFYYLLFAISFLIVPAGEVIVFKRIWNMNMARHFGVLLRKQVLNTSILGYSGDAYFSNWARSIFKSGDWRWLSGVKDSAILSAFASNLITLALLALFFATDVYETLVAAQPQLKTIVPVFSVIVCAIVALSMVFNRRVFHIPSQMALWVFSIHFLRSLLGLVLIIAQWSVVLPEVPLNDWLIIMAIFSALTRLPFLPAADVLLAGIGVALAGVVSAPVEKVIALFFVGGALSQGLNLIAFVVTSVLDKRRTISP